jgi:hypothetical protein
MATSDVSLAEKLDEPRPMLCPNQHHRLSERSGRTVYCEACAHAWRFEGLIDTEATESDLVCRQ